MLSGVHAARPTPCLWHTRERAAHGSCRADARVVGAGQALRPLVCVFRLAARRYVLKAFTSCVTGTEQGRLCCLGCCMRTQARTALQAVHRTQKANRDRDDSFHMSAEIRLLELLLYVCCMPVV